ncbi:MAG: hypothetical protein ACM3ZA_12210 [Bacillota bacterium]
MRTPSQPGRIRGVPRRKLAAKAAAERQQVQQDRLNDILEDAEDSR